MQKVPSNDMSAFAPAGESPQSVAAVQESIKTNIMRLILYSVDRPAPNLAHLLLGYNINKQLSQTELQNPGVCLLQHCCTDVRPHECL